MHIYLFSTIRYGRHVITALFVVNVDTGTDPSPTPIRMQTNKTERDCLRFFLWSLCLTAAVFVSAIRLHHPCFFRRRRPRHLKVWHTKKKGSILNGCLFFYLAGVDSAFVLWPPYLLCCLLFRFIHVAGAPCRGVRALYLGVFCVVN